MKRTLAILIFSIFLLTTLSACAPKVQAADHNMNMAAMDDMPAEVKASAKTVQTAYQFAVANPEALKQIPCYCGCGAAGHQSNYACYVKENGGGPLQYDLHATGCSICVDITLDTMRLMGEGKPIQEIKLTIDQTYARFGPSNMP